jgi:hypothetical protein
MHNHDSLRKTIATSETSKKFDAQVLLEKVSDTYTKVDDHIIEINKGDNPQEKLSIFLHEDNVLTKYWETANVEPELVIKEQEALEIISEEKLEKEPELINKLVDILIEAQTQNLIKRGVKNVDVEIQHIKDVVTNCQTVYPNLPILHLAAAVHDSYKFNEDGKIELGLHEIASTYTGTQLVKELLINNKIDLNLNLNEIELIVKLVKRTILTHGSDEFPEKKTSFQDDQMVGILFSSIYPKNTKTSSSLSKSQVEKNKTTTTITALNYLDAITGTDYLAFIKYNNPAIYENSKFLKSNSEEGLSIRNLGDFFDKCLFDSFTGNLGMDSGLLLLQSDVLNLKDETPNELDNEHLFALDKIVRKNIFVKNVIEAAAKKDETRLIKLVGKDASTILLYEVTKTQASFSKLLDAVDSSQNQVELKKPTSLPTERAEFDQEVENLINTCYQVATKVDNNKKTISSQK